MPYGWHGLRFLAQRTPPQVGRPQRDRDKVKAGRKAARHNRR